MRAWLSTHAAPAARSTNFPEWYRDIIASADLVDSSPVKGCLVLKPNGYAMWEALQRQLDARFKAEGVQNAYFPLLIPQSFFAKEAAHVEGFATECAVVTHHRLSVDAATKEVRPDPASELAEPLVIRPTSETMVWHSFGRWIHSHADLPLRINQWANVLRWEMHTRPFLRTSEFLWQEGHTAHASAEEAAATASDMCKLYAAFAREVLSLPVVEGAKPEGERFAGAEATYTIEAMMSNGWALQSGTSHDLGQNFSKAFGVSFEPAHAPGSQEHVWATSWGVSTRLLGAVLMSHGDDTGAIIPPGIAPQQVAIVCLAPPKGKPGPSAEAVVEAGRALHSALTKAGLRVALDDRTHVRPGQRFFEWERRGVPLRLVLGAREVAAGQASAVSRLDRSSSSISLTSSHTTADVQAVLDDVAASLRLRSGHRQRRRTYCASTLSEVEGHLQALRIHPNQAQEDDGEEGKSASTPRAGGSKCIAGWEGDIPASASSLVGHSSVPGDTGLGASLEQVAPLGWYAVPWADAAAHEAELQARTKLTVRCLPAQLNPGGVLKPQVQEEVPAAVQALAGKPCIVSGKPATHIALIGRAY